MSEDRARHTPVRENSSASESASSTSKRPGEMQDGEAVDDMLARLSSAMNIPRARSPAAARADLAAARPASESALSLDCQADAAAGTSKTNSNFSSSSTLHENTDKSTATLDSLTPSHQPSTSHEYPGKHNDQSRLIHSRSSSRQSDVESLRPGSRQTSYSVNSSRRTSRHTDRSLELSREISRISSSDEKNHNAKKSTDPRKKEISMPWKKKNGKKLSKTEVDKRQMEMEMWNASDSTVLENLICNKGHLSKWQAVATARGLCSLSNNCRCPDCQSSYVTFDNDGDAGLGAGAPLYHIVAPACSLQ